MGGKTFSAWLAQVRLGTLGEWVAAAGTAAAVLILVAQNKRIRDGMKEAGEKAENAMDSAVTQLVTSAAQGVVVIGGGYRGEVGGGSYRGGDRPELVDPQREVAFKALVKFLDEIRELGRPVPVDDHRDSALKAIKKLLDEIREGRTVPVDDHRDAIIKAIQKFLDQVREL